MITDSELKVKGLKALREALGTVEAEKFLTLIMREPFDYTKWQGQLWPGKTVEEISRAAMRHRRASRNRRARTRNRTAATSEGSGARR
jgi:hypothetical protein